jgi:hypothetical protein
LGLDYAIFHKRINGSFEYYFKKGIDLFGDSPLAPSTGLSTFRGNDADITGSGLDLVVNSDNIRSKTFSWQSNLIVSHSVDIVSSYAVKTTVSTYLGQGSGNAGTIYPLQGKPLYAIYSYPWAGLSHTTGDPQGYLNGAVSTDYTSIISGTTPDNMEFNGSAKPTTYGSFRNTFVYKGFSLSANMVFKLNYFFRRSSISSSSPLQSWIGNSDYLQRWQKPGDELITNVPSLQYPPVNSNRDIFYQFSDALVEKGDHVRLQDISIGYTIAPSVAKKLSLSGLQIYGYINNVGLLWTANKKGLDPDIYSQGYTTALPLPRTIALGLKANF